MATRDISHEYYRYFYVTNYLALVSLVSHIALLAAFAFFGLKVLALYNIVSIAVYAVAFLINRRGFHDEALAMGAAEAIAHSYLATLYLSWHSAFHLYMLLIIPLMFLSPKRYPVPKPLIALAVWGVYSGLQAHFGQTAPLIVLNVNTVQMMSYANTGLLMTALAFIGYYYSKAASKAESELRAANERLEWLAKTDPLTKLSNRRNIMEILQGQLALFEGTGTRFSVAICDIDGFKGLNDTFGHECGDQVLASLALKMSDALRKRDYLARWGGEEFLLVLPDTDVEEAYVVAERVREHIDNTVFHYGEHEMSLTLTIGVSMFAKGMDIAQCVNRADKALYEGKRLGKNCVCADQVLSA